MRILFFILFLPFILFASNNCVNCHKGIEPIRDHQSDMMKAIFNIAQKAGHPNNDCIVCHGGNPNTMTKTKAHNGTINYFLTHKGPKNFYPMPDSPSINQNTCGMCHAEHIGAQNNSLMMTEQGKIQGTLWSFGAMNGYKHDIGNFKTSNPTDPHKRLGTDSYRKYMQKLSSIEPQVFPKTMKELPPAPTAAQVQKNPKLAAYTYLRQECQRCHTGSKGRNEHGDYRGIGCGSCHIPYSNSGRYEGGDKTIDRNATGKLLVHAIQSSRKVKVTVNGHHYSGVPVETCTSCHNRGKRIGVSYQGLMESEYDGAFFDNSENQPKLHTKKYMHLESDIHMKKGMLCQDCHTSNDLHGDGFLSGTTLAPVEIECQDCHGTTTKYPWELPLGYSDEFGKNLKNAPERGLTKTLAEYLKKGIVYPAREGYLLSARGNPLKNVVKHGSTLTVHLSSGKDILLKPLKTLRQEKKLSKKAIVAMEQIKAHNDKLECYTCHATWAPQCYGCHVKIDYSDKAQNVDWLKAAHDKDLHGRTGDMKKDLRQYLVDGKVSEARSYLRWENPPLANNGEGRVSPTIPGCQTTITVIGKDGKALVKNQIFKIPNVEGAGKEGQNAIDMSPVQPHTISKRSRTCESCHTDVKALGYGIDGGKNTPNPEEGFIVDLMSADGKILSQYAQPQMMGIKNLKNDWSRFLDENGTQLQTVDHHWKLGNPLTAQQRLKLDRQGVCLSCHQSIPEGDLAIDAMTHAALIAGVEVDNEMHGDILGKILHIGAWVQVTLPLLIGGGIMLWWWRRKRGR